MILRILLLQEFIICYADYKCQGILRYGVPMQNVLLICDSFYLLDKLSPDKGDDVMVKNDIKKMCLVILQITESIFQLQNILKNLICFVLFFLSLDFLPFLWTAEHRWLRFTIRCTQFLVNFSLSLIARLC